jgi:type II secretory pathway pseudopilin PulG
MKMRQNQGFTIIEVVLFLAISGLMLMGILAALSANVNQQRYMDSVRSLQDFLQGQYNLVSNARNNAKDYICDSAGGVQPGAGATRGKTDCTLIGRYIRLRDDDAGFVSEPIYAKVDVLSSSVQNASTEAAQITALGLTRANMSYTGDDETYTIPWQVRVTNPGYLRLVIIRLPMSGLIRTYWSTDTSDDQINEIIAASHSGSPDVKLCVNPDGLVSTPQQSILIRSDGTNANAVQFKGDDSSC